MKNKIVKTSILIMCALLLLSAAFPPAASAGGSASLTLNYLPDVGFRVYLVATPGSSGYEPVPAYAGCSASFNPSTAEGWRELAQVLAANTGSTAAPVASGKTDANGSITFTGLAAGMYLVMGDSVRRNNVEYTPNPFVVTLTEGQSLVCQVKGAETPYDPVVKSVTVKKVWANDRTSVRPTGVVIQLLQNGTVYDTQVLSAATGWTYTWRELDAEKTWSVRESSVPPGYTASIKREGDVFTVTNTYTASSLPSGIPGTGDDAQMALYLAAALTSLAAFAVLAYTYRKRRGEQ